MTDPFSNPAPARVPDRADDPFGIPSDSGRATRMGDAEDRALVPRDQWGRYLLPHLDGTKPVKNKGFTRVSTQKQSLSNTIGIQKWSGRRIVDGLASSPELVTAAMRAMAMPEGKEREQAIGKVAAAAFDLGGGKERAGKGTEFHEFTEKFNRGELPDVPKDRQADASAYVHLLQQNNIRVLPDMLERQVMCPYNVAGTFDNMVEWWNPDTEEWELVIADLKTGRSLDLGWLEIEIQLWNYANAYGLWTTTNIIYSSEPGKENEIVDIEGYYDPMPRELRQDKALIFHCPLDGTATLYVIDLSGVERYVKAAVEAKRANAEAKNKVTMVSQYRPGAFITSPEFVGTVTAPPSVETRQGVVVVPADAGPPPFSAPIHVPRPDGPTPEQAAAAEQASARIAKVDAMAKAAGRNDDDDEARPVTGPIVPPGAPVGDPSVMVIERDPVTNRKKRTCGFCHLPGHQRKTCPQNPDSPKYVKPEIKAVPDLPSDPVNTESLPPEGWVQDSEGRWAPPPPTDAADLADGDDAPPPPKPYCVGPIEQGHGQWTAGPDGFVCATCGKPSKMVWEQRQPPAMPPWDNPPDMIMWGIKQAGNTTALSAVRDTAIREQKWTEAYEQAARIRWGELVNAPT